MPIALGNFATAKIASAPSGTGGLSFTVVAGKGALFPTLTAGSWFYVVLKNSALIREVVKVSARATDAFTIDAAGRGLDGTSAYASWAAGDTVELCLVNLALKDALAEAGRWVAAGGTADAITANYSPDIYALEDGQMCFVRAGSANTTTTPTYAPDGLTAHTITMFGGTALVAGNIKGAGHELILRYNLANTRWELLNPNVIDIPGNATTATTAASVEGGTVSGDIFPLNVTTGGTSTAYTLTTVAAPALATGQIHRVTFHTAAGATPTLARDGLTAKNLKYRDSTGAKAAITSTQVPTGWVSNVEYDGTDYVVLEVADKLVAAATTATNQSGGTVSATSVASTGALLSSSASQGVGYTAGAGGDVTQATSKSTSVSLSKVCGQIQMHNASLAANTSVTFTCSNIFVLPNTLIVTNISDGTATKGAYTLTTQCTVNAIYFTLRNITAGALAEAPLINFAIIRTSIV